MWHIIATQQQHMRRYQNLNVGAVAQVAFINRPETLCYLMYLMLLDVLVVISIGQSSWWGMPPPHVLGMTASHFCHHTYHLFTPSVFACSTSSSSCAVPTGVCAERHFWRSKLRLYARSRHTQHAGRSVYKIISDAFHTEQHFPSGPLLRLSDTTVAKVPKPKAGMHYKD